MSAIGRFFKALGYLLTFRLDKASEAIMNKPDIVKLRYEEVIQAKAQDIQRVVDAVAGLVHLQEQKKSELKRITQQLAEDEEVVGAVLAEAQDKVKQLQAAGKSEEEIQTNPEYLQLLGEYNDLCSTRDQRKERVEILKTDIQNLEVKLQEQKLNLQHLKRDLDDLKIKAKEDVARLVSAQQEKALNDMLAGISTSDTARELEQLDNIVGQAEAAARVTSELAGTDTRLRRAQLLEKHRGKKYTGEFSRLVGLAKETDTAARTAEEEPAEKVKLPEV
jgi:hypothetical protein